MGLLGRPPRAQFRGLHRGTPKHVGMPWDVRPSTRVRIPERTRRPLAHAGQGSRGALGVKAQAYTTRATA